MSSSLGKSQGAIRSRRPSPKGAGALRVQTRPGTRVVQWGPLGAVRIVNRVILRDLTWALLVGVAVALSPHTSGGRPIPKILGGVAAAALVLRFRAVARRRSGEAAAESSPLLATSRSRAAVWALLLLFCAVFGPTAVWAYGQWTDSIWRNGHSIFVPFIMVWLARSILRRDAGPEEGASPWGFTFLFVGLSLAVGGNAAALQNLSALGLVLCLPGLSLLFLGARRTRALAPPLWLGLMLVPIPINLAPYGHLAVASATGANLMLGLLGVPTVQRASTLTLTGGVWFVSDACSGFSALVAAVGASVFLAFYSRSVLRRLALLLCPWPLVVVFNSFRTLVFAAFLEYTGANLLDTPAHGFSGIATYWAVMASVLLMADRQRLREAFG